MTDNTAHIAWLDTLRTLAILGVILIHIVSPIINMSFGNNTGYWMIANILSSAARFAVPLFLMLSGATLLSKEYKPREFYKKRFLRVVLPLLFWIVIYWIFRYETLPSAPPHGWLDILKWAVNLFLTEGVSKHFWYVYMIIFIYLIVPFLGKFVRSVDKRTLIPFILVWIVVTFISRHHPMNPYAWNGEFLNKFYGYLLYGGYLVLGYYIYTYVNVSAMLRIGSLLVFLTTIAVCAYITYTRSVKTGQLNLSVYRYLSLTTITQSISVFILLKNTEVKNKFCAWFQQTVSDYSFGIYLAHIMVLGIFYNHGIFWTMAHPLISIPVVFTLTLFASFSTIFILRKIPYGKYISG